LGRLLIDGLAIGVLDLGRLRNTDISLFPGIEI
jgi:hypothetical protein